MIDQEEMFDLFNPYTSKQYTVQYFYYDNLNVLIFNQKSNNQPFDTTRYYP
ncbi:MAG: hypothetical protein ACLSU6_18540 [Thomasclavelia ramosa]